MISSNTKPKHEPITPDNVWRSGIQRGSGGTTNKKPHSLSTYQNNHCDLFHSRMIYIPITVSFPNFLHQMGGIKGAYNNFMSIFSVAVNVTVVSPGNK